MGKQVSSCIGESMMTKIVGKIKLTFWLFLSLLYFTIKCAEFMEPIRSPEAIEAARKAARDYIAVKKRAVDEGNEAGDGEGGNGELTGKQKFLAVLQNICVVLLLPFLWLYDCFVFVIGERLFRWGRVLAISTKRQAHLFLNGMKPYECSTRITVVTDHTQITELLRKCWGTWISFSFLELREMISK